ncbi:hypothetical protein J6590_063275 [Homalodisca vitripennis]|nr:hypothetical protein J6590_063275 [Homalodisca vitripennis]
MNTFYLSYNTTTAKTKTKTTTKNVQPGQPEMMWSNQRIILMERALGRRNRAEILACVPSLQALEMGKNSLRPYKLATRRVLAHFKRLQVHGYTRNAQLCATGKHNMWLMGSARSSSIVRWEQRALVRPRHDKRKTDARPQLYALATDTRLF